MRVGWRLPALMVSFCLGISPLATRLTADSSNSSPSQPATSSSNVGTPGLSIPDTTSAINSPTAMSERVVHYDIDARYDAAKHTIDATEVLTYHNLTGQSLDHFPFHLYLNGFQPRATWVREAKVLGNRDIEYAEWKDKEFGSEEIKRIEVVGQGDLTKDLQFIQPDDGNKDDKTVVEVHLAKPVRPGAFVQFKIAFHDQLPETQARTGWKRDFVLGGQWFPKVGVWWQGAWNCHQFHATTEFFADFGVYDVKLTVPEYEVVGATGVKVSEVNNSDKTKTLTFHGDDIHDFAWTVSPRYKVKESVYQAQMGPVQLRILMQPAHWSQADRHEKILRQSLDRFESFYGPYPYKTLTLVDPEPGSAAGGMEYPTFITGDSSWFMPEGLHLVEIVVEHEFGHQYWYGMVATNEFEDAWLDEGINSYSEVKVLDSIFGPDTSGINVAGIHLGEAGYQSVAYSTAATLDPMAQKAYDYYSFNSYGAVTYGKTASVLLTLEGIIGKEAMDRVMRAYFMKYRFTHPTKQDFLKTVEEVSGRDLRWYFDQAVYGSQVLDYEVLHVDSFPASWYGETNDKKKSDSKDTVYQSVVAVHRKGDFIMPVEVEIKFSNGERIREHWDGKERWKRFTYEKKAKVESAEIDPDHKIWIDHDNFNNSRVAEPTGRPARKLANYWMFISQWMSQALTWWGV